MVVRSTAEVRAAIAAATGAGLGPATTPAAALLPALHALRHRFGYVDTAMVPELAAGLGLSRAEVHGVLSFYPDLVTEPPAPLELAVCRGEACQAVGADGLLEAARSAVARSAVAAGAAAGPRPRPGPAGERAAVREVFCLGNCAAGPSMLVDGEVVGRCDAGTVAAALRGWRPHPAVPGGAGPEADQTNPADGTDRGDGGATLTVYLPRDTTARALGAEEVAAALLATAPEPVTPRLVRTGSRGMAWLEPLLEVDTPAGRVGFGPVAAAEVERLWPALRAAAAGKPVSHPLALGAVAELPWLARQQRLIFDRVGVIDPVSVGDHLAHGGFAGLAAALRLTPEQILTEVTESGLRGRGGAGFPVGVKWRTVAAGDGDRYVVCNADEGDSGTFADRMLLEGDPFRLIEGMLIAGRAVGAHDGVIYLRSEYPNAARILAEALERGYGQGWLGPDALGPGIRFDLRLRIGAGSYVCGEETALLESLEGRRGQVRSRPPLPARQGLFGAPTVINNVLSLASVPWILSHGAAAYRRFGTAEAPGTLPYQLGGQLRRAGLVETGIGVPLRTLLDDFGGGTRSGRPLRAVQVGGPLGAYLPPPDFAVPMSYEGLAGAGGLLGHGGVVAFDDTVDLARQARFALEFCARESCGKCTPCRIGAVRGVELLDQVLAGAAPRRPLELLEQLCEVMSEASLCAMGGLTPVPVRSALRHFPADFHRRAPGAETATGIGEER